MVAFLSIETAFKAGMAKDRGAKGTVIVQYRPQGHSNDLEGRVCREFAGDPKPVQAGAAAAGIARSCRTPFCRVT